MLQRIFFGSKLGTLSVLHRLFLLSDESHHIKNESPKIHMDFLNGLIYGLQETASDPGGIIAFWTHHRFLDASLPSRGTSPSVA
ncbi:hypothetical protein WJ0W_001726 [Paenibacillus melissococcoides]|uniref:Uncharacterized protein n=1 Tax=Paenibacillus melissococcoides TaxID=2912268 RepID=A0ABN8U098_9BACL|nr:hypothetical protein [Paenibacillus dendritiformis]CAH8244491.1 hypothetical protein WJ0W_001726 [Paenibacillus melissococcoides]